MKRPQKKMPKGSSVAGGTTAAGKGERIKKQPPEEGPSSHDRKPSYNVRLEATIHAGTRLGNGDRLNLDIDRIPDAKGQIRALLTVDDCVRLLEQGFEIRLHHAHPIRPLDPALIETDEAVKRWLDEELRGIPRQKRPKRSSKRAGT